MNDNRTIVTGLEGIIQALEDIRQILVEDIERRQRHEYDWDPNEEHKSLCTEDDDRRAQFERGEARAINRGL